MEIVPAPCASILRTTRASHLPYNAKSEKNVEIVYKWHACPGSYKRRRKKDDTYTKIKKKMLFLINNNQTAFFKSLKSAKHKYIKNSENDVVRWTVDADGIAGETSGGSIKQDVTIQIFANGG